MKRNALMHACRLGYKDIVQILLQAESNIEMQDNVSLVFTKENFIALKLIDSILLLLLPLRIVNSTSTETRP